MARSASRGGSPRLNREINKALVMRAIRRNGPISRADVARSTGINPNTVSTIVEGYIAEGMVREAGEAPSGGGRPAVLVEIDATGHAVIGLEVGERSVRATLVDFAGNSIASVSAQPATMKPDQVLASAVDLVAQLRANDRFKKDQLLGVGVAVPGVVSPDGKRVLYSIPLGWTNVPLADELAKALKLRVTLTNNSLAISTFHSYFQTRAKLDGILIFIATFHPLPHTGMTNLGCGIILKGEAYGGHHHMAGEIAIGLPHPLTTAAANGLGKSANMRDLLDKLADKSAESEAVWGAFCRDLTQIVSKGIDLITPDLTLICSDLPELESLIGNRFRQQIVSSTVMGQMSALEHGPEQPRVEFETLKLTAAAHGAALPFLSEFEKVPQLGG